MGVWDEGVSHVGKNGYVEDWVSVAGDGDSQQRGLGFWVSKWVSKCGGFRVSICGCHFFEACSLQMLAGNSSSHAQGQGEPRCVNVIVRQKR
jgi:hypothetical protein